MAARPGRFSLFRIAGIPVEVNYTWFVIFVLLAWSLAASYFPARYPHWTPLVYWVVGVGSALLLFGSVLVHELAHSLMAKRHGLTIGSITLFIFGGVSEMTEEPEDAVTELRMAAAGPATSAVLCVFFYFVAYLVPPGIAKGMASYLGLVNGILAVFNLVPGYPLDGGRVLRALLWEASGNLERATRTATRVGQAIAILLMVGGFIQILLGLLLNGIWFVFIGLFLKQAAESGYQQVLLRKVLAGVTVESVMRKDVVTVNPAVSVDHLVDEYFLRHHYHCFPVVQESELLGMVTLANVKVLPRPQWPRSKVVSVMTPVASAPSIAPETEAVDALARMIKEGVGRFLVVEGKRLLGIISRKDIVQILKIRTDLGG